MNILHWNFIMIFLYAYFLLYKKITEDGEKLFVIVVITQLFFINGLRHFSVGTDSVVYYWKFLDAAEAGSVLELFQLHRFEPAFTLLQGIIGVFTNNYAVFFLIIALLIFLPLGIFIYRNSSDLFISFFMYIVLRFFDFSMNGVRQSIAISITIFAFNYAIRKELYKFIITVLIASLFHYSAIIVLPMYIIVNYRLKKHHLYYIGILFTLFYMSRHIIGQAILNIYYSGNPEIMSVYEPSSIGMMGIFILFIIILGGIFHNPFDYKASIKTTALFNLSIVAFFIHSFSTYSYLFKRLNFYYLIFLIIYIPEIFQESETNILPVDKKTLKEIQKVVLVIMLLALSFYYLSIINQDYFGLLPYGTFFDEFEYVLNRFE